MHREFYDYSTHALCLSVRPLCNSVQRLFLPSKVTPVRHDQAQADSSSNRSFVHRYPFIDLTYMLLTEYYKV